MDESKLIFFTGAPGSKWSAVAHILTHTKKISINTSDYNDDRVYTHPGPKISHLGAYWGPGFEFGSNFHELHTLTKEQIIEQIEKPYADNNWEQYRLIKCHQFSLNLDFITEMFPKSVIINVLRPDDICLWSWYVAGGFEGIKYPDYNPYYKNKETMAEKIAEENYLARKFIIEKNLPLEVATLDYWNRIWGIQPNTDELERYMNSLLLRKGDAGPVPLLDTQVSVYNMPI